MKVIFLDIDGVLNCYGREEDGSGDLIITRGGRLSKSRIELLNKLAADTDAKIVISSTWRMDTDVEEYLVGAGIKSDIIGKTPILKDRFSLRGNEIHAWIVENEKLIGRPYHDFYSFAILDDDSDMLYWHRENLFLTDGQYGLTPAVAYRATRFLNRF